MTSSTEKSAFWQGARQGLPFILVISPFGLLFGVVATEAGFNLIEVMGFTILVIAGASQFAAIQMMTDNAPTLIVLATALAVNLRMAMYSASLAPHLGPAPLWKRAIAAYLLVDQPYALSATRWEENPDEPIGAKLAFFFGIMTVIAPFWYGSTLVGAVAGTRIPEGFALDFALPITFLATIGPALRTPAHIAAAVTSVIVALLLVDMPYNTGLLLAGLAAMIVGAQVELMMERRK